jgi:hypothetical protein
MTEIHYEAREQDLIAFNEHQLKNSERVQKAIRRHQAHIPALIAVIALLLFFYFKDIPSSIYALMLAMAWGLGVPFYLKWNHRKQIRQSYTDKEIASFVGHYTLKAEPDGLGEIDAAGETSKLPWKKVLRVELEKKYVYVYVGLDSALIIPVATLSKDSKLGAFVKAANDYIEKAG